MINYVWTVSYLDLLLHTFKGREIFPNSRVQLLTAPIHFISSQTNNLWSTVNVEFDFNAQQETIQWKFCQKFNWVFSLIYLFWKQDAAVRKYSMELQLYQEKNTLNAEEISREENVALIKSHLKFCATYVTYSFRGF